MIAKHVVQFSYRITSVSCNSLNQSLPDDILHFATVYQIKHGVMVKNLHSLSIWDVLLLAPPHFFFLMLLNVSRFLFIIFYLLKFKWPRAIFSFVLQAVTSIHLTNVLFKPS